MLNFKYRKHSNRSLDIPNIKKVNIYKFYIVYKTINLINGKEYIGTHCSNYLMDDYIGSGSELNKDIEELGMENFKRFNIQVFYNHHDMVECERRLVDSSYLSRPDTYNIAKGGSNLSCSGIDEKYLDKIRKKCVDYEIEDYSKLIDHLCILRNELIYIPDIKSKPISFKSAAKKYYELSIIRENYKIDGRSIDDINDEMKNIRKSHSVLDDALDHIDINRIKSFGYHVTKISDDLTNNIGINNIKNNLDKYGLKSGDIISEDYAIDIVTKMFTDEKVTMAVTKKSLSNFFNIKNKMIKGEYHIVLLEKK